MQAGSCPLPDSLACTVRTIHCIRAVRCCNDVCRPCWGPGGEAGLGVRSGFVTSAAKPFRLCRWLPLPHTRSSHPPHSATAPPPPHLFPSVAIFTVTCHVWTWARWGWPSGGVCVAGKWGHGCLHSPAAPPPLPCMAPFAFACPSPFSLRPSPSPRSDNCPFVPNPGQGNRDGDTYGTCRGGGRGCVMACWICVPQFLFLCSLLASEARSQPRAPVARSSALCRPIHTLPDTCSNFRAKLCTQSLLAI